MRSFPLLLVLSFCAMIFAGIRIAKGDYAAAMWAGTTVLYAHLWLKDTNRI